MRRIIILNLLFLSTALLPAKNKFLPRNEICADPALVEFVCKLQYAVFKKDTDHLLSLLDNNIKNSFGGEDGIEEFKTIWRLDSPNSPVWFYLSKLISLGGTFQVNSDDSLTHFVFPYVFQLELPDTVDYWTAMVITEDKTDVRENPGATSEILGQLSYGIVYVRDKKYSPPFENAEEKKWYHITTLDKKLSGFVSAECVWSPAGYRMFLQKESNKWKIVSLISGD